MVGSKHSSIQTSSTHRPVAQRLPTRLSHRDVDLLLNTLLELYAHRDLAEFKNAARRILGKVVPFEWFTREGRDLGVQPEWPTQHLSKRGGLLLKFLLPHFHQAYRNASLVDTQRQVSPLSVSAYGLSPREIQIARWLAQGKSNPEIALILQISPRTVEKHMERILQKLKVENRATAAVLVAGLTAVS